MKLEIHPLTWFLKPFKDEGYLSGAPPNTNLTWAKSYSILCFTLYTYSNE